MRRPSNASSLPPASTLDEILRTRGRKKKAATEGYSEFIDVVRYEPPLRVNSSRLTQSRRKLLQYDPALRLSASTALDHVFFMPEAESVEHTASPPTSASVAATVNSLSMEALEAGVEHRLRGETIDMTAPDRQTDADLGDDVNTHGKRRGRQTESISRIRWVPYIVGGPSLDCHDAL